MSKKLLFSLSLLLLIIASTFAFAQSSSVYPLQGSAWSSNIGWVKFNPTNYGGVFMDISTGIISGYAWANPRDDVSPSNNVGWLSFNDYSGCPTSPCQPKVNMATGAMSGWAKFLSVDGGWDGWVHLSGTATSGTNYGGTYASATKAFSGYVWGGTTVTLAAGDRGNPVGWIRLDGITLGNTSVQLPVAPNTPANLRQTNAGACDPTGGAVNIAWDTVSPAPSGYFIYRTDSLNNVTKLTSYSSVFSDGGLTAGGTYRYRVSAFNSGAGQVAESSTTPTNAPGTSFVASTVCRANAITFQAIPSTVALGGHCNLLYTVTFGGPSTTCTITSASDKKFPASFNSPTGGTSGSTTTSPLNKSADYTLTCSTLSARATCSVAPKYNEF